MNRAIDSATVLIPYYSCSYVCPDLDDKAHLIRNDEILKEYQTYPIFHEYRGIHSKFAHTNVFQDRFISIVIKAKMLQYDYFEGINLANLPAVYDYIISLGYVYFTYEQFLNSTTYDIDYKTDFILSNVDFRDFVYKENKLIPYTTKFTSMPNIGIEYNKRLASMPSNPYLKYYSKGAELMERSNDFRCEFLPKFNNPHLRRCEITVGNSTHKKFIAKHTGIEIGKTLKEVFLSPDNIKKLIEFFIDCHHTGIKKRVPDVNKTVTTLTSTERLLYNTLFHELQKPEPIKRIMVNYFPQLEDEKDGTYKTKRSRMKNLVTKLYDYYIETDSTTNKQNLPDLSKLF